MLAGHRERIAAHQLDHAGRGAGVEGGQAGDESAQRNRRDAVHVLGGVRLGQDRRLVHVRGKRVLDQDAVDGRVGVEHG